MLRQEGVQLDLVHRRDNLLRLFNVLQVLNGEVADTNRFHLFFFVLFFFLVDVIQLGRSMRKVDFARVEELLHRGPGVAQIDVDELDLAILVLWHQLATAFERQWLAQASVLVDLCSLQ